MNVNGLGQTMRLYSTLCMDIVVLRIETVIQYPYSTYILYINNSLSICTCMCTKALLTVDLNLWHVSHQACVHCSLQMLYSSSEVKLCCFSSAYIHKYIYVLSMYTHMHMHMCMHTSTCTYTCSLGIFIDCKELLQVECVKVT